MGRKIPTFGPYQGTARRTVLILAFLGCLLVMLPAAAAATQKTDEFVPVDENERYFLSLMGKDDKLDVKLTIKSGGPGDLYVMKSSQYYNYQNGDAFLPAAYRENVSGVVTLNWTQPDDDNYYLVVDNRDNSRATDAYSRSNITYDIYYDYTSEDLDEFFAFLGGLFIVVMVIGLIINILILVWIYKDAEKRGKSGIGWVIFALLCGPLAWLIWLLVRPPELGVMGTGHPGAPPGPPPGYGNYPQSGGYPPSGHDRPPPPPEY